MRLVNAKTLRIEHFNDEDAPSYAILSHTWDDEEVTYQEMNKLSPSTKSKAGYRKVESTCEMAQKHGLDYAWVDTCCIDKTSSSELQEAINSMYRYYKQADVCFAYLSDVEASKPFKQLSRARWFTRGWTLQELLAPDHMLFFSRDWVEIGSRTALVDRISTITRIEQEFLLEKLPQDASVAKRMSWASRRQTTRPEDLAYSLLGIFDVFLPLLYGEGSNAFIRLQEEIMRVSDDQSLFAWGFYGYNFPSRKEEQSTLTLVDRASTKPISMLAPDPGAFQFSGKFIPYPRWRPHNAYAVTHRGVHIHMPLLVHCDDDLRREYAMVLAVIGCHESNTDDLVLIRLFRYGADQYSRTYNRLLLLPRKDAPRLVIQELFIGKYMTQYEHAEDVAHGSRVAARLGTTDSNGISQFVFQKDSIAHEGLPVAQIRFMFRHTRDLSRFELGSIDLFPTAVKPSQNRSPRDLARFAGTATLKDQTGRNIYIYVETPVQQVSKENRFSLMDNRCAIKLTDGPCAEAWNEAEKRRVGAHVLLYKAYKDYFLVKWARESFYTHRYGLVIDFWQPMGSMEDQPVSDSHNLRAMGSVVDSVDLTGWSMEDLKKMSKL